MSTSTSFTFNGDWEFELTLDSFILFDDFISEFESQNTPLEGKILVTIEDDLRADPDPLPQQIAAINYLLQNQQQVLASIYQKVQEEYPQLVAEYHACFEDYLLPFPDLPALNSSADLGRVIKLQYLLVDMMHKEGYAYVGFAGTCAWDEEHGVGFRMHKDRVIEFGAQDTSFSLSSIQKDGALETPIQNPATRPVRYSPHPKYGKLKPSQQDANDSYEERLMLGGYYAEFIDLVENHQLDINEKKAAGMSFLERATQFNKIEMAYYLFSKNVLPSAKSLHFAAENFNKSLVELHLQHGIDINQFNCGDHVFSPLVQKLVFAEYNPGHREVKDYDQYVDMIRWLRTKGANPYLQNEYGRDVFYRLKNLTPEVREKISQFLEWRQNPILELAERIPIIYPQTAASMNITSFFKAAREAIATEQYHTLQNLHLDYPSSFNWVTDIFCELNLKTHPQAEALIWRYQEKEKRYTFQSIYAEANQFLNFLRKYGIQQGQRIYTQLPLDPANWIVTLAAIKGGLILVPAAINLIEKDIAYRFQTIFPEVVITDLANTAKIEAAENMLGQKIKVKIVVDGNREGWHSIEVIQSELPDADPAPTRPDDHLFYFFTSGTTGLPKIVTHTHSTYPFGHLSTASWVGMRHGDIHYNISAPGWAKFAWSSFFAPWSMGATIFANQVDKFDAKEQLKTIEKYQVTTFCAPPTVLRMMILEDFSAYQFKFRQCAAAGKPLNAEIIEKWQKGTGVLIRDGYGQTETTCLVCNLPGDPVKFGSMGKATFLYDVVIADEAGMEQPLFEEGSICIRMDGPQKNGVFVEYLGEPERNAKVFKHGLYYTGDKAYKDEEGYIWFVGRDDDVIKASDFRIGPFEVESALIEHAAVVETAVVASPHAVRGFAVKAFVLLRPELVGDQELADALFAHCEQNLTPYKIPRIIEFVDALPKTISGKIRRVELRASEAQSKSRGEAREREFFHKKY